MTILSKPFSFIQDTWLYILQWLNHQLSDRTVYLLFFSLALLHFLSAYPGGMSSDTWNQYTQALSGHFSDHHPPMMSFLWALLLKLYPGPAPMLCLSLSMLWASFYYFYRAIKPLSRPLALSLLFFPLAPALLSQSTMLWKDVFLWHSVLLVIAILTYHGLRHKKPSFWKNSFLVVLLFFAMGLKFQAKFFIFPLVFWLIRLNTQRSRNPSSWIMAILLMIVLLTGNTFLKNTLSTPNHSEQMRQFFDMAGIAVMAEDPSIFPDHLKNQPYFSVIELKFRYTPRWVNPYVFRYPELFFVTSPNPLFISSQNPQEIDSLHQHFLAAVWKYPYYYCLHRGLNLAINALKFKYTQYTEICCNQQPLAETFSFNDNQPLLKTIRWYTTTFGFVFGPNLYFYIFVAWGLKCSLSIKTAPLEQHLALGIPALTACLFILTLFFTTMASDYRYSYLIRLIGLFNLPLLALLIKQSSSNKK
jgi:hypothetical protein